MVVGGPSGLGGVCAPTRRGDRTAAPTAAPTLRSIPRRDMRPPAVESYASCAIATSLTSCERNVRSDSRGNRSRPLPGRQIAEAAIEIARGAAATGGMLRVERAAQEGGHVLGRAPPRLRIAAHGGPASEALPRVLAGGRGDVLASGAQLRDAVIEVDHHLAAPAGHEGAHHVRRLEGVEVGV